MDEAIWKASARDTRNGRDRALRVAVLVDLEQRPAAGGHVKFWEHIAHAAAVQSDLELSLHFQGTARSVERLASNVELHTHRPVLNSARFPGLAHMPDHSDLSPWHPGLAAQLRGVNLVHATDTLFAFARTAKRWCRWHNVPLATSLHTDSVAYCEIYARETLSTWLGALHLSRAQEWGAMLSRYLREAMEKRAQQHLQESAHVLASGTRLHALARSNPDASVSQLRRGLDPDIFSTSARAGRSRGQVRSALGIPDSALVICFSGRLSAGKQVRRVARTAAVMVGGGHDVHAVFAGQGAEADFISNTLGNRAHVLGHISQTELGDVLRAGDIFVFPSQVEIWANAVAEARACGLPVIVDAAGGGQLISAAGDDGLVIEEDDDKPWVLALKALLESPSKRRSMREAGLRQHEATVPTWQKVLTDDLLTAWRQCAQRAVLAPHGAANLRA